MTKAEKEFNQCIKETAEFIRELHEIFLSDRLRLIKMVHKARRFYFPDFILWGRN